MIYPDTLLQLCTSLKAARWGWGSAKNCIYACHK